MYFILPLQTLFYGGVLEERDREQGGIEIKPQIFWWGLKICLLLHSLYGEVAGKVAKGKRSGGKQEGKKRSRIYRGFAYDYRSVSKEEERGSRGYIQVTRSLSE